MAKLSTKARKKLPAKDFAGPGRSFPIPDKAHAIAAERLAPYSERKGNISKQQEMAVLAKARAFLQKNGKSNGTF